MTPIDNDTSRTTYTVTFGLAESLTPEDFDHILSDAIDRDDRLALHVASYDINGTGYSTLLQEPYDYDLDGEDYQ